MNATPKTIQIFLPGGDPRGIRIAEITTRIMQVIEVPRSLLPDFLAMPESNQVALYFLFGDEGDGSSPSVYIGQTGDLRARLANHNQKKEFWQRALVWISRTNSLTQTHTLFLEWFCLQESKKAGRYADANGNKGSRPHTPAPLAADCHEIFETGRTLLATLGYPVFEPVAQPGPSGGEPELFYCKASGANAMGLYTSEGFVLLKGSLGRLEHVASFSPAFQKLRVKLIEEGILVPQGNTLLMSKDHLFNSPSTAAMVLLGRSANGWTEWRNAEGKTLDELKRNLPEAQS
jgi:hypothetical protein